MFETQTAALVHSVRKALEAGSTVVILGWYDTFHDEFTRGLVSCKRIVFHDKTPDILGGSVGFVLFTKCVGHTDIHKFKHKKPVHPFVLRIREIRYILKSCGDLLSHPCSCAAHHVLSAAAETPVQQPGSETEEKILDFITTPVRRCAMSDMGKFAVEFSAVAEKSKPVGFVGKKSLGVLLRKYGVKTRAAKLVEEGWIIGKMGVSQVGSYTAGPKMLETIREQESLPEDSVERARVLIAREPTLLKMRSELSGQLATVENEIETIRFLKDHFDGIVKIVEGLKK